MLVAVQRPDGSYVHPDGDTTFGVDDILWVVGHLRNCQQLA